RIEDLKRLRRVTGEDEDPRHAGIPLAGISERGPGAAPSTRIYAPPLSPAMVWPCPRPANTPDVGVSPRGGCSNGEEGGGEAGGSLTTAIVHGLVQGGGHCLGATGGPDEPDDLSGGGIHRDGGRLLGWADRHRNRKARG